MTKLFLLMLSVIFSGMAGTRAMAESESTPQPPFVSNTSAYATWTMTFIPKQDTPAADPSKSNNPGLRMLKEVRVSKRDKEFQEVQLWSNGVTTERWEVNGLLLFEQPDSPGVYLAVQGAIWNKADPFFNFHSHSDFPEFSWLSSTAYAGEKSYQGRDCYRFKSESPSPSSHNRPREAWIDVKTRLPVALDDGRVLCTYAFGNAPSREVELPARFAEVLKNYQKKSLK